MNTIQLKIVVKVEIRVLLDPAGMFDRGKMERLSMILSNLVNSGARIFIISSGAIFLGAQKLRLRTQPVGLVDKQAVAAVGQAELMKLYRRYFESYNQTVAQVLLTGDVFTDVVRRKNAKNTLSRLAGLGVIPVINENDSVSTEDIELNDNYYLVRNVAELINAHLLLIKTGERRKYILISRDTAERYRNLGEKDLIEEINRFTSYITRTSYINKSFPAILDTQAVDKQEK